MKIWETKSEWLDLHNGPIYPFFMSRTLHHSWYPWTFVHAKATKEQELDGVIQIDLWQEDQSHAETVGYISDVCLSVNDIDDQIESLVGNYFHHESFDPDLAKILEVWGA